MSIRPAKALLAATVALPLAAHAQLTRFQPAPRPAPRPPAPRMRDHAEPSLKRADQQDAWYRSMLWCRSHPDQNRSERKACRADAAH